MNRDEVLKVARKCFTDKEFSAVTYESGPYDITNPTLGLKHFAAAIHNIGYAKGAEDMREQAADMADGPIWEVPAIAKAIRALPITTEGEQK